MIYDKQGDLFQAPVEALVNTVNTVGVMGKGIALQFKEAFRYNHKMYLHACNQNKFNPGDVLAIWDENFELGRKLILNFSTKKHWRQPSRYEYIEKGLPELRKILMREKVQSVAIPPLGCGNGGLDWGKVRPMIVAALSDLDIEIHLYKPIRNIKEVLQKGPNKEEIKLTPARSTLLYALFAYESLGEYASLFTANKLAYLLQRMGQPLRLKFTPHYYGPFSLGVKHVLYQLNGVFLSGLEQKEAKPFEPLRLNYEKWEEVKHYVEHNLTEEEGRRLNSLLTLIDGFTSELSLEMLATVDYILAINPGYSYEQVLDAIAKWDSRKKKLFKPEHVKLTYEHLNNYKQRIFA